MRIRTRIEILERKYSDTEISFWMADGSVHKVRSKRLFQMISELVSEGPIGADTMAVIDSVRDNCMELGQGRLPEVMKVIYAPCTADGMST